MGSGGVLKQIVVTCVELGFSVVSGVTEKDKLRGDHMSAPGPKSTTP